jgi:hypothetical protein
MLCILDILRILLYLAPNLKKHIINFELFINYSYIYVSFLQSLDWQGQIAYNVPAVYDGFLCPIKEREAFQGTKNCGWSGAWEAQPT